MISWRKTLTMKIQYILQKDYKTKSSKLKELALEYDMNGRFNHTMVIVTPGGEKIMVDAEFMKQACEKVIAVGKI